MKLSARVRGGLLALLLLAAAAAAGMYLPRLMAGYEDTRRRDEIGVYEMDTVNLAYRLEDIGERMERIHEDFAFAFDLEKGMNLDTDEVDAYVEELLVRLQECGILREIHDSYRDYTPQLRAQKDGNTMIIWEVHVETYERGDDAQISVLNLVLDDTTGAILTFSLYREYAGRAEIDGWNGTEVELLIQRLAELIRDENDFAAVEVLPGDNHVAEPFYFFQNYRARLTDRKDRVYEMQMAIDSYTLTFNNTPLQINDAV